MTRARSGATTCSARERGVPRLDDARDPADLGDRRDRRVSRPGAGPRTAEAARGLRRGVIAERPRSAAAQSARRWTFDLSDEQRLISETARDFADNEVVAAGPRERPRRALRPRAGPAARRDGLPRRPGRRGVRRPRARLRLLRADRRAGRPRRQRRADRDLGPDLARLRLDRALGQRGAEAALAAAALLRRAVRLLRADRARLRLRRRLDAHPRRADRRRLADQRPEDVDLARQRRRRRAGLRPDRPREGAPRARLLPRPDRHRRLLARRRSTASSGCAPPTPPRSPSTGSRSATTRCSARSATASRSR